jgi:uncharacterized protein
MIQSSLSVPQHPSRLIWPAACMFLAMSFHATHAATPKMQQLLTKAEKGSVDQQIQLAEAYLTGNGVPRDPALAAHWYEKAAQGGDPQSQNLVGQFYQAGLGVPVDPARAFHWYQLAASSGSSQALLNMGVAYALGLGVKKDAPLAVEYFRKAAGKGNGTGAAYLGIMSYAGLGINKDVASAEHWFAVGEKLHDPVSAYNLGILYSTAPDHPHDDAKAAKFLRESSDTGYLPAMHGLAIYLLHHPELAKFPGESVRLAQSAADAGYWRSSVLLGILARDGIGMPIDQKAAYYHFAVALLQSNSKAAALLTGDMERLSAKLGPEQVSSIDSEANQWFMQHHSTETFVHSNGRKLLYIPSSPDMADIMHSDLPGHHPEA